MARAGPSDARPSVRGASRDWGRTVARVLCLFFALVGLIPLSGGLILRSPPLKRWAAAETARLLRDQFGVTASFSVELSLIPLRLAVTDLVVPSNDGGGPAVATRLAAVSPRFFSLLAGRLDAGDVELEDSHVRLVIQGGKPVNVTYRLPPPKPRASKTKLTRSPFRSLTVTNATMDLQIEGVHVRTESMDLDAFAEPDLSFDVALRLAGATVNQVRAHKKSGLSVHDEDRLCALDLRVQLSPKEINVRRLSLLGAVDLDPASNTPPSCAATGAEKLALRLSQFVVTPREVGLPLVRGRLFVRAPAGITNRFVPTDFTGWVGFSGELAFDGKTRLPAVAGQLSGEDLSLAGKAISKRLNGTVAVTDDVVRVPQLEADWGNGTAWISDLMLEPFAPGLPFSVKKIESKNIDFPGIMRDIDVTRHTVVDWNYDHVEMERVAGTIQPFSMGGSVDSRTSGFAVYNKGFDDPTRQRMIGVKNASIAGRWRANTKSLDFFDVQTVFGKSRLPVELVSISFGGADAPLIVRLKEGAVLDLADIGPIAQLEISGTAKLGVSMQGPMVHPSLDGTVSIQGFSLGGFDVGDLQEASVHFEPLFVEFKDLRGTKNEMKYRVPTAKLDFDGPATVEFSAAAESESFLLPEFFRIFRFDEDPRFREMSGRGKMSSRVRYVMGGPEDACGTGRLSVQGSAELSQVKLLGESYTTAQTDFDLDWFDIDAGLRGFRLDVPSAVLRKGAGSLIGKAHVEAEGVLSGHFVGTRIPLTRIDMLSGALGEAEGTVSGMGRLGGKLEQLAFDADVDVSEIVAGGATLLPSALHLSLIPTMQPLPSSGKTSGCGHPLPPVADIQAVSRDTSDGQFHVSGNLFGGQVKLDQVTMTSQRDSRLRGKIALNQLDLGALLAVTPVAVAFGEVPHGTVSGTIELEEFFLQRPFDSRARVAVTHLSLASNGYTVTLTEGPTELAIHEGALAAPHFALVLATPGGPRGVLDGAARLERNRNLQAQLSLRETSLAVLAGATPAIERAEGRLTAGLNVSGRLGSLDTTAFLEVKDGKVSVAGLVRPLSKIQLRVDVDATGARISRGQADWGGGIVTIGGGAPLARGEFGLTRVSLTARDVTLPLDDDVRVAFDADLELTAPLSGGEDAPLPRLSGNVNLLGATYERAMTATADISQLTGRGRKTEVDAFEAGDDRLALDLVIRAKRPLVVKNALVDASLELDPVGLKIAGTDRRFGAVGNVEVVPGGRIFLRRNAFEVKSGLVRFNDPTRLRPEVDVTAGTDFRRFEDRTNTQASVNTTASTGAAVAGSWRIALRAYGPPDDLRVDLTSDPPLAQDDIFLLLTVGLTRTELDQARSAGVGSSVALEALGSLSGAESAVTETVPIDEFRFGSTYSARSGRTEPTVTIGKRLGERLRASVTTSLSDTNEVRSNLEYRATKQLSVEGSYDNAQRAGAPALGNLGGDVRWRLEFD